MNGAHLRDPGEVTRGGVNVAGFLKAELGIGEAARLLVAALREAGIPYAPVEYQATVNRKESQFYDFGDSAPTFDTNIICVNADGLPHFALHAGDAFFRDRYTIGLWFWEVEEFPDPLPLSAQLLDEIWVASAHAKSAIEPRVDKPVFVFPLPVLPPRPQRVHRDAFGLPEGFRFLFMFDYLSILERKNPIDLVHAFGSAFAPGSGAKLILKTTNSDQKPQERARLHEAVQAHPDVAVLDRYLTTQELHHLMQISDAYASLHRAEGFGLTMAEMMALGKPVIATAYSGNLEFMTDENSYLVPCGLTTVPDGCDPYPAGTHWAQPDLEAAAALMRRVVESPEEAARKGEIARTDIHEGRSPRAAESFLIDRLDRAARPSPKPPAADVLARQQLSGTPARAAGASYQARELARRGPQLSSSSPERTLQRVALRATGPLSAHAAEIATLVGEVAAALEAEQETLQSLQSQVLQHEALQSRVLGLESALLQVTGKIDALVAELRAIPFMTEGLETTDDEGRRTIGFERNAGPADVYLGFEEVFRGGEDFIRERQRRYLELVRGVGSVVDLGCGRGEFLDLLRDAGADAKGVDIDAAMVARSRAKGHDVAHADVLDYLRGQPPHSIGAVFSAQVIEHLSHERLVELLQLAHDKLVPGGIFIAETVNPHSLMAAKTFWVDRTHDNPVFPEVAVVLCRLVGFARAYVLFPLGSGNLERDRYTQGEYAVVAKSDE